MISRPNPIKKTQEEVKKERIKNPHRITTIKRAQNQTLNNRRIT